MRKETERNKGFTLIEVIAVLAIIAILAAIAVPTGIGYMEKAKQTARDKAARSIFLAAQKSLSTRVSSGDSLSLLNGEKVNVDSIKPEFQDTKNKENIVFLKLQQSTADKNGQALYQLLERYLAEPEFLENTVLIEFNKKTGKVYSAFYSDAVSKIAYGAGDKNTYNANNRSEGDRKDGKMGYWGVESTGSPGGGEEDVEASVRIVDYDGRDDKQGNDINGGNNYGLLTVECVLPSAEEMETIDAITVSLRGEKNESITIYNQETGDSGKILLKDVKNNVDVDMALENDFTSQVSGLVRKLPLYVEQREDGRQILVWVLDCQVSELGIYENHPDLVGDGTGTITAEMKFEPKLGFDDLPVCYWKGTQYSLFGGRGGETTAYDIKSIRHLNNIRHTAHRSSLSYTQSAQISCRDYKSRLLDWEPIGPQLNLADERAGMLLGFSGKYDGQGHTVYDLTVGQKDQYNLSGLFSCISGTGEVSGLELDYTDNYWGDNLTNTTGFIKGKNRVGGIAGENWGVIARCTVQGRLYAGEGEAHVGGIAGRNMSAQNQTEGPGILTQCATVAAVTAASHGGAVNEKDGGVAGGIAGSNYGQITYCENGTATSKLRPNGIGVRITGEPYFGAAFKESGSGDYKQAKNDIVTISGIAASGGIAGENRAFQWGRTAAIEYCVNAAKVESGGGDAGGIAGRYCRFPGGTMEPVGTEILHSYNAGGVSGQRYAGGIAGNHLIDKNVGRSGAENRIESCYNTGKISWNDYAACEGAAGLAGQLGDYTILSNCYNAGEIEKEKGMAVKTDGIFAKQYGETASFENCAAREGDPNNQDGSDLPDRRFLKPAQLSGGAIKLKGMEYGGKVGPFNYPYPHFDVNETGKCKLGTDFHRTPFDGGN